MTAKGFRSLDGEPRMCLGMLVRSLWGLGGKDTRSSIDEVDQIPRCSFSLQNTPNILEISNLRLVSSQYSVHIELTRNAAT
ncbi:hypothetical protein VNO77_27219 [Canavalia gladiata]|uniref:Uncharacterized protein n=1 Tax=Canavalia gladiata TaxID=3824 RepID=A0AAN9KUD4_CANGL